MNAEKSTKTLLGHESGQYYIANTFPFHTRWKFKTSTFIKNNKINNFLKIIQYLWKPIFYYTLRFLRNFLKIILLFDNLRHTQLTYFWNFFSIISLFFASQVYSKNFRFIETRNILLTFIVALIKFQCIDR